MPGACFPPFCPLDILSFVHFPPPRRKQTAIASSRHLRFINSSFWHLCMPYVWAPPCFHHESPFPPMHIPIVEAPVSFRAPPPSRPPPLFHSPALVKIGQALSARPDLLPRTYLESLSELQDRLPSFPNEIAYAVGWVVPNWGNEKPKKMKWA